MTTKAPIYFLLVDDREENLLSLEALLRREGLECLKAHSGPEALELLLQQDVALALVDVQMPGMDGFELAELMRGNTRTGAVPIIFLTAGAADQQRRFRGYQAGAVDFINKPIEPDILRSKAEIFFQLKQQKNQLARQRDELQAKAEENARLLSESRQYAAALQEADKHKDEFIATLAHELRNPLATISGGLQILRISQSAEDNASTREMMNRQLGHLTRLIEDLFDVSRISRGHIELRLESMRLQDALKSAVELSRPLIDERQHELTLEVEKSPLWLQGDPTRLAQAISNILSNAAKYTPPGGRIQVKTVRLDRQAILTIEDNGQGISAEMLPRVFDLFTQAHPNQSANSGLGIGLALARRLVEQHGGSVVAESPGAGSGSVFTLTLPLQDPAETPQAAPDESTLENSMGDRRRILVVDDNEDSAMTLGRMLDLTGHQCALAHSGRECLDKADSFKPHVILLDIGLPDTTGYEVCRQLRLHERFADTLIIAQTGWGQEQDIQRSQQAGFDHHLVKPLDLSHLNQLIASQRSVSAS